MDLLSLIISLYVISKDAILNYFHGYGVVPNDFEFVIFSFLLMIIPVVLVWLSFKLVAWFFKL